MATVMGLLLLVFLLIVHIFVALSQTEPPKEEAPIPVTEYWKNVWIKENAEGQLLFYHEGEEGWYPYEESLQAGTERNLREQLADVTLTDRVVTDIRVKTEKISGKVLRVEADFVELEGYGRIDLSPDYQGYRLYGTQSMCTVQDLYIGYDFADFVLEEGKICGILFVRSEWMEQIRVLIKDGEYQNLMHESVMITADTDYTVYYGALSETECEHHGAGEVLTITQDSSLFLEDRILVIPAVSTGKIQLTNVARSQGYPSYRGKIELIKNSAGIAVVNEVPLEEYLYSVLPSEMPASYPIEALKAQAVCARTYAYSHMQSAAYPEYGAHVDDSTAYQVYNNIAEQESTSLAVRETAGMLLLTPDGKTAGAYYYSTSCGVGSEARVWKTKETKQLTYLQSRKINRDEMDKMCNGDNMTYLGEELQEEDNFKEFILGKDVDDFEATEGWYRWTYRVDDLDVAHLFEVLQRRFDANENLILTYVDGTFESVTPQPFKKVYDLYIAKREKGGVADELVIETDQNTYKVISEHNIRYVLNDGTSQVIKQDGSMVDCPNLLPSGFFVLTAGKEKENVVGYTLIGGGFGHGVGMSQNGAKQMALEGYSGEEILRFFYGECQVKRSLEWENFS